MRKQTFRYKGKRFRISSIIPNNTIYHYQVVECLDQRVKEYIDKGHEIIVSENGNIIYQGNSLSGWLEIRRTLRD